MFTRTAAGPWFDSKLHDKDARMHNEISVGCKLTIVVAKSLADGAPPLTAFNASSHNCTICSLFSWNPSAIKEKLMIFCSGRLTLLSCTWKQHTSAINAFETQKWSSPSLVFQKYCQSFFDIDGVLSSYSCFKDIVNLFHFRRIT